MQRTDEFDKNFFLGGVAAFIVFFIFLALFFFVLFSSSKVHQYGLKKDKYFTVSLETIPVKQTKKESKQANKTQKKSKHTKRKSVDAVSEDVDVDSLFNNVWTKKVAIAKKKKKTS